MEKRHTTSLRLNSPQQQPVIKDISQSLGKLPPQACELEEVILGALMLESKVIEKVPFLKPDHFYLDKHKEIFRAIKTLQANGTPQDMRLVVSQLRSDGKIELVGGAYYIADLTNKVSSSQNVEEHARVVVEMSMKRSMIEIASKIHYEAYEDTTDIFELLQQVQEDIKYLEERETKSSGPEKIALLWEKLGVKTKPDRPEALIMIGQTVVCTVGNISLLVGKKKSRKSLLTVHLLHNYLSNQNHIAEELVIFDTEQEEFDVWATRDRLYRMSNQFVPVFCLRGLNPKERRDFISDTITHWPTKLRVAVIDGIRDCMSNINDPDETTEVMSWLMKMNVETKIHFINILHLNKTDGNARGHIGSELLNKAEVTIEVTYDDQSTHSIVKCESSRRKPFDNFAFTHSATGLPEIVGVPLKEKVSQDEQITRLQAVFEGESLRSKEIIDSVKSQFACGESNAKKLIADFVRRGWVVKSGKDRAPNTTYKLMIDDKRTHTPPPKLITDPQEFISFSNSVNRVEETPPPSQNDEPSNDPDLPF